MRFWHPRFESPTGQCYLIQMQGSTASSLVRRTSPSSIIASGILHRHKSRAWRGYTCRCLRHLLMTETKTSSETSDLNSDFALGAT